ncbi:TetR family transcriptional regulator [Kineococcus terrestris]|uniref:TetR/AcrR family transcriptional regulator n=1 Tax=Kineococcus terrestris TaxID=2044856 RepID=UPI0034DAD516
MSQETNARPRRTGRRAGNPGTREAVLDAAREVFADRGFEGATIRAIAALAGVDPALVHHYFGSKDGLFLAAVQAPVDPAERVPDIVAAGADDLGANLVRLVLSVWDGPARPAGLALLRSATTSERAARMLREFLLSRVLRPVLASAPVPAAEREVRAALAAGQIVGLVVTRHVLRLEPVASAAVEELVAAVGPGVQRYLTGDVDLGGSLVR